MIMKGVCALKSSGKSGSPSLGSFHGAACLNVEKAHLAARRKGLENRKTEVELPPLNAAP